MLKLGAFVCCCMQQKALHHLADERHVVVDVRLCRHFVEPYLFQMVDGILGDCNPRTAKADFDGDVSPCVWEGKW